MKNVTVLFLIILMTSFSSCKYFKGWRIFGRRIDTMAVWQARQDSLRIADSIIKVRESLQAIENARLDSIKRAEEAFLSSYNIIVGSFITPEYAKAWADEYRNRGFNARIIKAEGSRFELVSAEAHENAGKAVRRLNQFRDTVQIDAWIYKRK